MRTLGTRQRRWVMPVLLGLTVAGVVLLSDIRARVGDAMAYCGNGLIGVSVPIGEDPSEDWSAECSEAVRRWRIAAAASAVATAGLTWVAASATQRHALRGALHDPRGG